MAIRNGIPQALPDGDVSGVFRSPCASSQIDCEAPGPPRKAHDRAEMGTTAAPEHER